MSPRPALIVPIRDRRKRRRILTLKNFRRAILGLAIFFLGVTIQSDLRHPATGEYGRLFGKQVSSQVAVTPRKVDIVREAPPVEDQNAADPLLLSAAAREQYLGMDTPAMQPTATAQPAELPKSDLSVVGGPNGVTIVRGKVEQHPTLSGGIFRQ